MLCKVETGANSHVILTNRQGRLYARRLDCNEPHPLSAHTLGYPAPTPKDKGLCGMYSYNAMLILSTKGVYNIHGAYL